MSAYVETWRVNSGWMWRVVGETHDYACELAYGYFPLPTQALAVQQANEYIIGVRSGELYPANVGRYN